MQAKFSFQYNGVTLHADAYKVRRLLLSNTDGRAWTYIRDLAVLKQDAEKIKDDPNLGDEQREAQLALNRMAQVKIEGILAEATITAFEFEPFNPEDGTGATEIDALSLLHLYMEFAAGKE